MALKVELKAGERILIGETIVTNHHQRTHLLIEGSAPIVREKDIMTAKQADTPAKRIYLSVLLMYTTREPRAQYDIYFALVRDIVTAAPSTRAFTDNINNLILTGDMYKALKEARKLVDYERKLLAHASRDTGVRKSSKTDIEPA
jgi:flagellar protein FlbT